MLYENLIVWQRSRQLAVDVYRSFVNCKDFGFKDQITRSVLSVPSNIAEGCERDSLKERRYFLGVAKGSVGEFKTQTDIGIEIGYISIGQGRSWLAESEELAKMLAAMVRKLNNS